MSGNIDGLVLKQVVSLMEALASLSRFVTTWLLMFDLGNMSLDVSSPLVSKSGGPTPEAMFTGSLAWSKL